MIYKIIIFVHFFAFTSASLQAQTQAELNTLFFDPVYLNDADEILLSSAQRNLSDHNIPVPVSAPASTENTDLSSLMIDIDNYEKSINDLIRSGGSFDPSLAQEYLAISELYQQTGEYEKAVQALENNMHIERVNNGLYSLAQTQAIRKLIENNKADRNYAEADKYHEYLYYLMTRSLEPGNEELTASIQEWADWNLEAYRRLAFYKEEGLAVRSEVSSIGASMLRQDELIAYQDNQFKQLMFVQRLSPLPGQANNPVQTFMPQQLLDPRLKRADELFDLILESDPENQEILLKKAEVVFLFKTQLEKYISNNIIGSNINTQTSRGLQTVPFIRRGYSDNRKNLLKLASNSNAENPMMQAQAYLNLADWDLAFDRLQGAKQNYEMAHSILVNNGFSEQEIQSFITPEPALFVPAFVDYEDTRRFQNISENIDIPYIGYIDVSFSKRTNGSLRYIKIENTSENTSSRIRKRLRKLLETVKTRPLLVNGQPVADTDIKVRYYYSY